METCHGPEEPVWRLSQCNSDADPANERTSVLLDCSPFSSHFHLRPWKICPTSCVVAYTARVWVRLYQSLGPICPLSLCWSPSQCTFLFLLLPYIYLSLFFSLFLSCLRPIRSTPSSHSFCSSDSIYTSNTGHTCKRTHKLVAADDDHRSSGNLLSSPPILNGQPRCRNNRETS